MECQLDDIEHAITELSPRGKLRRLTFRLLGRLRRAARLALTDPNAFRRRLGLALPPPRESGDVSGTSATAPALAPLGLTPGEHVRVKTKAQILATLDAAGRYRGLAYVPPMDRYCGTVRTVRKRVDRFFDERTRRMLRLRDVVILDEAICETAETSFEDFAGCNRTCFLFWSEAWLERP
ncbi:MAG: hypothetical protein HYV63_01840 [Candidatus Schekmanbacteria bacterium]|nr:hypothetical protein [Candidatus Schekmanbacteria bacterium]